MRRFRVYIADMDAGFVAQARSAIARCPTLEFAGSAASGRQALAQIEAMQPDVLLSDIPLPEMDGLALLREARQLRRPPEVIVCTRFYSSASMTWASRYGAAFFLCKPIDFDSLPKLIAECCQQPASPPRRDSGSEGDAFPSRVNRMLREMGIPARLSGSAYIVEALTRLRDNPLLLKNLSHGLYSEVSGRMDTTVPRVERAIRNAIGIAHQRHALDGRFPGRPSNREFLEYLLRTVEDREAKLKSER